jgi:hypothetical protein
MPARDAMRPPPSRDPTRTGSIRRAFRNDIEQRLRRLKMALRKAALIKPVFGMPNYRTAQGFDAWFTDAAQSIIVDRNGYWLDKYIRAAYELGLARAREEVNNQDTLIHHDNCDAIVALAQIELQGATDAMVHNASREMGMGLVARYSERRIYRAIVGKIDEIGRVRLRALASTYIVRAFNAAKLDLYEASGVARVGILPETRPPQHSHDHASFDAVKIRRRKPVQRRFLTKPGAQEQTRIERREAKLSKLNLVNVLTAGDDDVCVICEGIEEAGPYTIDEARSLIPAHPNCRCAFIPFQAGR